MVGNVDEWTDEWYAGAGAIPYRVVDADAGVAEANPGTNPHVFRAAVSVWPPEYGGDSTGNVNSSVYNWGGQHTGVPAAAIRGGTWTEGVRAGVYKLDLTLSPTFTGDGLGFRCVIRR